VTADLDEIISEEDGRTSMLSRSSIQIAEVNLPLHQAQNAGKPKLLIGHSFDMLQETPHSQAHQLPRKSQI